MRLALYTLMFDLGDGCIVAREASEDMRVWYVYTAQGYAKGTADYRTVRAAIRRGWVVAEPGGGCVGLSLTTEGTAEVERMREAAANVRRIFRKACETVEARRAQSEKADTPG